MTKTIKIIFVFFILFSIFPVPAFARKLSADEKKIVGYVNANSESVISFLVKTVNIESATENLASVTLPQQTKRAALLIHRLTR